MSRLTAVLGFAFLLYVGLSPYDSSTIHAANVPAFEGSQSADERSAENSEFALIRAGTNGKPLQPYRVQVGDKDYDFAHLLKLRPANTDGSAVRVTTDFEFRHPGLLSDLKELEFVKKKIAAGEAPWASEFEKMKKSRFAQREYLRTMPQPPATTSSDFNGKNNRGFAQEMKDANAAYTQVLMWYFTGDEIYAKNAAGILETYANTVVSHGGQNWYLNVAWAGSVFPLAAELLRSTYPEWTGGRLVGKWFNDVFLPPLYQRIAFGNREFAIINALAAIGVYNEDLAAFYLALNHWVNYIPAYHYISEDGPTARLADYWTPEKSPSDAFLLKIDAERFPSEWNSWIELHHQQWSEQIIHGKFGDDSTGMKKSVAAQDPGIVWSGAPVTYLPGYTAETARDLSHVEQSFASEINVAEIAWHQGIDIYTPQAHRLTQFMEMEAQLRLGVPPPESMTAQLIPYGLVATWEIAYNHYAGCMGQSLPYTQQIVEIVRHAGTEGIRPIQSQMAGKAPENQRLWLYPPPLPPLFASNIGAIAGWISSWETVTHAGVGNR